jgi:hypothetical protein
MPSQFHWIFAGVWLAFLAARPAVSAMLSSISFASVRSFWGASNWQ